MIVKGGTILLRRVVNLRARAGLIVQYAELNMHYQKLVNTDVSAEETMMNQGLLNQIEAGYDLDLEKYVLSVWQDMEGCFHVLEHGNNRYISSHEGAHKIIWIFKDWVENNGGWKDIQNCNSRYTEEAIHRWMQLGAKTYLGDQNLDMNVRQISESAGKILRLAVAMTKR